MATVYGPDKYTVPTLNADAPDIPATLVTLLDSMRPSLIGHASSIADRTAKYGMASTSSIQAPKGTVVVSAELSAIWVKTSSTLDQWSTIVQHSDEVATSNTISTVPNTTMTVSKFTIPDDGIYSLYATMDDVAGGDTDGQVREMRILINGQYKFGGILSASRWWFWSGSRAMPCSKGDIFQMDFLQRSDGERVLRHSLAYQRIL